MARLTVEDCLENVDNRYDLVLLAGKRTRQLLLGKDPLIEDQSNKPTVIALREIAEGVVTNENIDELGKPRFDPELEDIEFHPVGMEDQSDEEMF